MADGVTARHHAAVRVSEIAASLVRSEFSLVRLDGDCAAAAGCITWTVT